MLKELGQFFAELNESIFSTYRPERHYMRGPGPKTLQRLQRKAAATIKKQVHGGRFAGGADKFSASSKVAT